MADVKVYCSSVLFAGSGLRFGVSGTALVLFLFAALFLAGIVIYRLGHKVNQLRYADILTGTWNLNRFRKETSRLMEQGKPGYALIYLDIDRFKYINDTLGYSAGDRILICLSECIASHLGGQEISARISADNFVVLAQMKDEDTLKERLSGFYKDFVESLGIWSHYVVLNAGVYFLCPEDRDPNFVIERANYARTTVRYTYASNYTIYTEAIAKELSERKKMEEDMVKAFREKEFMAYYQPKVELFTGKIVGAEALVRWNHPIHSILPPRDFLCCFEENGFIVNVDFYIFEEVCKWLRQRLDENLPVVPVSCNFSRLHLRDAQFVNNVKQMADKYRIPLQYLEVEITENFAIENMPLAVSQLQELKKMGFNLSIDDFGSAYSSLELLNRMPVDVVKLDKSFLDKSNDSIREKVILRGVIDILNQLNLEIVCEGVETEDNASLLKEYGCRIAQGFLYSRPVPISDFERMLDSGGFGRAGLDENKTKFEEVTSGHG